MLLAVIRPASVYPKWVVSGFTTYFDKEMQWIKLVRGKRAASIGALWFANNLTSFFFFFALRLLGVHALPEGLHGADLRHGLCL